MENEFRFLEFEGIQVAAFVEGRSQNEHTGYYSTNILYYVRQGQFNIRLRNQLHTIETGCFCIVRKHTEAHYFKTWSEKEGCAIINAMALQDDFINDAIRELGYKIPTNKVFTSVINLRNNTILQGLYDSLMLYITENQVPDKHLMALKTKEALLGIIQSNPDHLALFHEFSRPVKADLKEFIHHHLTSNLPLRTLAKLSGRSLSTFNRDFRKIFNASPPAWLLKKRLAEARNMLLTTDKKASEIYLDLGFKDLAPFSRSIKKEFQISPSAVGAKKM